MLTKLKKNILDVLFPPHCVGCARVGSYLCPECRRHIIKIKKQLCPECRAQTNGGRYCSSCAKGHSLRGVLAAGYFKDPILKELIHQYKYEGLAAAAGELTALLQELVDEQDIKYDILAFVPTTRRHRNLRGYNQSELLARELGRLLDAPVYEGLCKIKNTKSQVGLRRNERLRNLRGCFIASPDQKLCGRRVLIVDDVLTTGATLGECARALKAVGARSVTAVVLARE